MNLLNTLTAWQWALLAAIPAGIVLLYFLRLKRQPIDVPSTYLWTRTIEDLHVNTIWQRLRQNLLLFLQLLLVALLMAALLRPGWRGTELTGDRFVFLIDTSASMGATDVAPTRLAQAKQRALEYVEQMKTGDVAMVISFSDQAKIEQAYTDSRRQLRQRIEQIQLTNRSSDLREALRAAAGLANPGYTRLADGQAVDDGLPATLYIFSDGRFEAVPDFSLGNLEPRHVQIGAEDPRNVAILAFSVERNPEKPESLQAFARLENFGPNEVRVPLELWLDNELVDASEVSIPAAGSSGTSFELPEFEEGTARLTVGVDDALALDNRAFAVVNRNRPANVLLVTSGNEPLELACRTSEAVRLARVTTVEPSYLQSEEFSRQSALGTYDCVIFDRCAPEKMPQANTLFLASLPPLETWQRGDEADAPFIIDVDRVHPLLQLLDFDNVAIARGFAVTPPAGGRILLDSVVGGLLAIAPRQGFEDAVLGFALVTQSADGKQTPNTDWYIRRSFPVFAINVLRYLGGMQGETAGPQLRPGQPAILRAGSPVETVTVQTPQGSRIQVARDGQATYVFGATDDPGVYEVREADANLVAQRFAVNLFDANESRLVPAKIEIGSEEVTSVSASLPARKELWKLLVAVGLVVLLVEWYVYNRRVYI